MEKFNFSKNDPIQEEIVNSESEISSDIISDEEKMSDIDSKPAKNKYDQKVPAEEIEHFQEDIIKKIEDKAMEFGISKEDLEYMNENFDGLIEKLKENITLDKEQSIAEFEEKLKKEIAGKISESGKSEKELIANDKELKKLTDKFKAEKEKLNIKKDNVCHSAVFDSSDNLKKDFEEKTEEYGMSEENFKNAIKIIEESDFEKFVKAKAEELEISEDILYEFMNFDLNDLKKIDGENESFRRGEFELNKKDFYDSIDEIQKDENGDLKKKELSKFEKFMEFMSKHKKPIALGELSFYLSSFGTPALNFLVNINAEADFDGHKISLANNPELAEKINQVLGLSAQTTQEHFSQELADIYEEVKDLPDRNIKYENLDESIEEADKYSNYAELIQNGEKESMDDLVNNLDAKGTDVILFGEWHGPESNAVNAVEILEKLQDKDRKIGKIALEFLSYTDPKAVELVKQFNNGEISAKDFYYSGCLYARSDIRPLLEFAQDNKIPITGIEAEEHFFSAKDLSRFTDISHKIGEIAEDKEEDEMIAVFIGVRHTTESNFNLDDPIISEYKEGRGEIDKNDYTVKEYLEESGFNPAAINLDEWKEFAKASDEYFRETYNTIEDEDANIFGDHCIENWEKYKLDQEDIFVVNHGDEKNVYSVVSPNEITETPPYLNALKNIEDNHPILKEIMHKQGVFVIYGNDKISLEYNGEKMDVAQIDSETGQIKEIFLPEEKQHDDKKNYELDYSKELTIAYNEASEANKEEHEFKDLKTSIELAEEVFQYPEMIKSSEKILLDDFIKDLSKEEFDNLIIGEYHGFGPTEQEAAHIIEELIKNNRKVSAICLEGLSFEDPEKIEATKKFNEGKMSDDEIFKFMAVRESLLKTARDNSIEIMGIDTDKEGIVMGYKDAAYYDRFTSISEKIGEITEEKGEDGIVVTYIGQGHVTTDSWEKENALSEFRKGKPAYPQEEEALESNYTIKEYLEKKGFNPVAFQAEDWEKLTKEIDSSLAQRFKDLPEEDRAEFYDFSVEKWKNYVLEESEVFVTEYPGGEKNTFSVIIPSEIPKTPPILNGYKTIYDNPYLSKILDHEKISIDYGENIEFSIQINGERAPIIEIDKTTGEPIKMYLPEQAKDFQEDIKDRVFSQEKLKEILTQYDSRHKQEIEGNKKLRDQYKSIRTPREERMENVRNSLKSTRDKLKKIYARKNSKKE